MYLKHGKRVAAACFAAVLLLSGCTKSHPQDEEAGGQTPPTSQHTLYFQGLSEATVSMYVKDEKLQSVQTSVFNEQRGSTFELFVDENMEDNTSITLVVEHTGTNSSALFSTLQLHVSAKELRKMHIVISALSLLQELYDEQNTDTFASKVLRSSVDDDGDIDREDVLLFLPNNRLPLVQPNLLESFENNGIIKALLNDENISALYREDNDGDTLTKLQEILLGALDTQTDTDHDGLSDIEEFTLGTSLYRADSDFDGLSDRNETLLGTSALLADSDDDYIGDASELHNGSDPLDGDENSNGIKDGLEDDPLLFLQWHLHSEGTVVDNTNNVATVVGNDLNIFSVNARVPTQDSKPKIQVIDTGVEAAHEDLEVDLNLSSNAVNGTNDPTAVDEPSLFDKTDPLVVGHGTAVAGIVAAKTQNGLGVRGVVPGAVVVGSNWLENGQINKLENLWYYSDAAKACSISNNSWGAYFINDESFEQIMELAVTNLRDKKGRIFVLAAGNERKEYGNANLSYIVNNPYVFAVGALNYKNKYASYSNPGANLLVCAYGGERYYESPTIATTLLTGKSYYASELYSNKGALTDDADTSKSYTVAMNGTSAATPMVSGVLALTLEACPDLSWRDLKYLVAKTAIKVDANDSSWQQNAAGIWHSNNYGFGLINASEMISQCQSGYFQPLGTYKTVQSAYIEPNIKIPDNNTSVYATLQMEEDITIEWVGLKVKTNHTFCGDLNIDLISPSGTKSQIITSNDIKFEAYKNGFRFSSLSFLDESSAGVWKVIVRDAHKLDNGILQGLQLIVKGR